MAYVRPNFKTKKALRLAVEAVGTVNSEQVQVFERLGLGTIPKDGEVFLEGPHYPAPHTWYATGTMRDGKLVKVR